jgi:dTDP-glucose pyrophosphorylase
MAHQWENVLITEANTIREALEAINGEELRIALVVNSEQGLTGIVTDGDIRRGLLNGVNLEDSVSKVVNRDFVSADAGSPRENLIELMKQNDVLTIPLISNGVVVGIETLRHALEKPKYQNPVFLMAGGLGTRLLPLTETCPKPMLYVGKKPILEIVLGSFIKAGFFNFYISTHYMEEKIRQHFGDGSQWNANIQYIHEQEPLGTGGALGLLPDDMPDLPIIMMNGDILTKVDFERMLAFHSENNADATMCVREYDYQIPYGVISGEDGAIVTMVEKPTYQYFVNAGIYVVSPDVFRNVPKHSKVDMPELLEQEIKNNKRVLMFPIHEYWLDIGRMDDFERAQAEFHALGLD